MPAAGTADGKYVKKKHWSAWPKADGRRATRCGHVVPDSAIADSLDAVDCKVCRRSLNLAEPTDREKMLRVEVRLPAVRRAAVLLGGKATAARGTLAYKVVEVTSKQFKDEQDVIDFLGRHGIRAWDEVPF